MSTIIKAGINGMPPIHPGEVLREEFLAPLNMSVTRLAAALKVPSACIHDIVEERAAVTADVALRLARYFGGDAQSWLNLQQAYDLKVTGKEIRSVLDGIEPIQHISEC